MAALDNDFNKTGDLKRQALFKDIEGLTEKSAERLQDFRRQQELAESGAKTNIKKARVERITSEANLHEMEPRPKPFGLRSKGPRVSKEQVEAFFDKMEQKGITSAAQVKPENKVEQIIQHTWHAVQKWEKDQEKERAEQRLKDTRDFVDKLMTLDDFNLAATAPRGPHDGRSR